MISNEKLVKETNQEKSSLESVIPELENQRNIRNRNAKKSMVSS